MKIDTHTVSGENLRQGLNSFWQYTDCADVRSGSLERKRYRTVGSRVNVRFEHTIFLAFQNYTDRQCYRSLHIVRGL